MTRARALARVPASAVCATALLLATRASAETENEKRAQALFDEAVALASEGRYAEACPRIEESQRLDPGLGTQFNLADCYAHVGRTASAWAAFDEVARLAHAAGKDERERLARARAQALVPALAKLVIRSNSLPPDSVVRRDGVLVPTASLNSPTPVDAGEHVVEVSAPGRLPFRAAVRAVDGTSRDVVIPELPVREAAHAGPPKQEANFGPQRIAAIATASAGVVALGVGSVFGALAITRHGDAVAACPDPADCASEADAAKWNDATAAGNAATVLVIGGVLTLAGAAVLWFTAPRARPDAGAAAQSRGFALPVHIRF